MNAVGRAKGYICIGVQGIRDDQVGTSARELDILQVGHVVLVRKPLSVVRREKNSHVFPLLLGDVLLLAYLDVQVGILLLDGVYLVGRRAELAQCDEQLLTLEGLVGGVLVITHENHCCDWVGERGGDEADEADQGRRARCTHLPQRARR